jgi:hypothetical protein
MLLHIVTIISDLLLLRSVHSCVNKLCYSVDALWSELLLRGPVFRVYPNLPQGVSKCVRPHLAPGLEHPEHLWHLPRPEHSSIFVDATQTLSAYSGIAYSRTSYSTIH